MELKRVSLMQAKSLKKLGYPQDIVDLWYYEDNNIHHVDDPYKNCYTRIAKCPVLEEATKWLREEKGIDILPIREFTPEATGLILMNLKNKRYMVVCILNNIEGFNENYQICNHHIYKTYDEALSAGIDIAIEILNNPTKNDE